MLRRIRLQPLSLRQRRIAVNVLLGSGALLTYGTWRSRRPLLADSNQFPGNWKSQPQVGVLDRNSTYPSTKQQSKGHLSPTQIDDHVKADAAKEDEGFSAWETAIARVSALCASITTLGVRGGNGSISDLLLPSWASILPMWIDKLRNELSMAPWSLSWEIWEEAHDPEINPEIIWDAQVRISKELCEEEKAFLRQRQKYTTRALAKYLDVPDSEVHAEDVPIIAMCGSGGGLRALVAGASSYLSAQEDGLFDCVTYTAGVSGSCWLQSLYFSSIGQQNYGRIIDHLKQRLDIHIAHPASLLALLNQSPTNKYLLSGFVEKLRGVPDADFGLVDVYGLALAARLFVPRGELRISDRDLKISNQRVYTDDGTSPLPIYTAVRHEIPEQIKDVEGLAKAARCTTKHYDWFQWFEWTPYELFTEELDAGIPTWAVGRQWRAGNTDWRENGLALPELRIPLYLGIWGSAFCATLSHYYKEVRPILKASGLGALDALLSGKSDDLSKLHPIDAAVIPNYILGLSERIPDASPNSLHSATHLALMDAGMANNLPIYPLLRPGREVDVIIAFDASADVRGDNWIKVVDGYVEKRGIKGWPLGAGWPPRENSGDETIAELDHAQSKAKAQSNKGVLKMPQSKRDLGYCTVWAGTKESQEYMDGPVAKIIEDEEGQAALTSSDAGVALIYFPFLANEKVEGVDPLRDDFMSTWNFVYTDADIEKVVALARANYREGKEQTKRTIRAVWERKRNERQQREKEAQDHAREYKVARGLAAPRRNGDYGQGDQFGGGI